MHSLVARKVNAYFAVLLITIAGSAAVLLIEHTAHAGAFASDDTAQISALEDSL